MQETRTSSTKPQYTKEFKEHVATLRISGRTFSSLQKEYGVAKQSISNWVKTYEATHPQGDLDPLEENRRLRQQNAELEKEILFLKKAAAFFAKEQV